MSVFEQLEEYCNCVEVKEKDVNELINLISMYTCWVKHPCETFLLMERREVIDIPPCLDGCQVFTFEPYYRPFDPDTFTFTLVTQDGMTETATEMTDWMYSAVDENFKIQLPNCKCSPICGCAPTYKLIVEYAAGYEEIPDCLLPVFCEALDWIREKNNCDCSECQECGDDTEEGVIDITKLTGRLQDYFLTILAIQYHRQLSLISLCGRFDHLWGIVK